MKLGVRCAGVLLMGMLSGCSSLGGLAGAVVGVASGTVTSNPAVGIGVGIAVQAGTDSFVQKLFRDMQADEQNRIAAIAGTMEPGQQRPWDIHYRLPFNDERGELRVLAVEDNALTTCKEVMFSVAGGAKKAPTRRWFVTQTCRQPDGAWRWAAAEPAVGRWGALQ